MNSDEPPVIELVFIDCENALQFIENDLRITQSNTHYAGTWNLKNPFSSN